MASARGDIIIQAEKSPGTARTRNYMQPAKANRRPFRAGGRYRAKQVTISIYARQGIATATQPVSAIC